MFSLISRKLKKNKGDVGNLFGLFKNSVMPQIKDKGRAFVEDNNFDFSHDSHRGLKERKDRNKLLKKDIL